MKRRNQSSADRLRDKLKKLNPDTDAVAIFKPGEEVVFYIPDGFAGRIRDDQPVPPYVMAVLIHAHMYAHYDNPVVQEFIKQIKQQVMLDLATETENGTWANNLH